jgi:hypothetical protein
MKLNIARSYGKVLVIINVPAGGKEGRLMSIRKIEKKMRGTCKCKVSC